MVALSKTRNWLEFKRVSINNSVVRNLFLNTYKYLSKFDATQGTTYFVGSKIRGVFDRLVKNTLFTNGYW